MVSAGCALKQQAVVYSRTKDIRFSGKIKALKGEPMLSVTWKYAKQNTAAGSICQVEEPQDCFRSELVYDGVTQEAIRFLIKNYICGTYTPVGVTPITVDPVLPTRVAFHSMNLKILTADDAGLVFEDLP